MADKKLDPKKNNARIFSFQAFLIVAQESNPFLEPQKSTIPDKKRRKLKKVY